MRMWNKEIRGCVGVSYRAIGGCVRGRYRAIINRRLEERRYKAIGRWLRVRTGQ